jgi:hypothetical protein
MLFRTKLILLFLALVLLSFNACTKIDRENPFDPNGDASDSGVFALKATADTSMVILDWSSIEFDVDRYILYRSIGENNSNFSVLSEVTSTGYVDSTADSNAVYNYQLTAIIDGVESNPSITVEAEPIIPAIRFTLVSEGSEVDTLELDRGKLKELIIVELQGKGTFEWQSIESSQSWMTAEVSDSLITRILVEIDTSGLEPGITHYASIVAISGSGQQKTLVIGVPIPDLAAPVISDLYFISASWNQVEIGWSRNTDVDFSHYRIYKSPTSDVHPDISDLLDSITDISDTTLIDTGLTSLDSIYYLVVTVDTEGLINYGSPIGVQTPPKSVLRINPTDVSSQNLTGVTVSLNGTPIDSGNFVNGEVFMMNPIPGMAEIKFELSGYLTIIDSILIANEDTTFYSNDMRVIPSASSLTMNDPNQLSHVIVSGTFAYFLDQTPDNAPDIQVVDLTQLGQIPSSISFYNAAGDNGGARIAQEGTGLFMTVMNSNNTPYLAYSPFGGNFALQAVNLTGSAGNPFGLAVDNSRIIVAGAEGILMLNRSDLVPLDTFSVSNLRVENSATPLRGPQIRLEGDFLNGVNGGNQVGQTFIFRIELSSGTVNEVTSPITLLTDIYEFESELFVSSKNPSAGEIMILNQSLQSVGSIPIETGVLIHSLEYISAGDYEGFLLASAEDSNGDGSLLFIDPVSRSVVGQIDFASNAGPAYSVAVNEDGSKILVACQASAFVIEL